jgi:hypothetical protein
VTREPAERFAFSAEANPQIDSVVLMFVPPQA